MQRRPYSESGAFSTLICNNPECDNISSKLYIVEDKIIESLKIWLSEYRIDYNKISLKRYKSNIIMHEESIAKLKKELNKEEKKLTKAYDFLEDGVYTKDVFNKRLKTISYKIDEINNNIQKHIEQIEKGKSINKSNEKIIPKFKNILELYDALQNAEDKNNLLKAIIEKVTYIKTTKAIKKDSNPTDFEITIYPKIAKD